MPISWGDFGCTPECEVLTKGSPEREYFWRTGLTITGITRIARVQNQSYDAPTGLAGFYLRGMLWSGQRHPPGAIERGDVHGYDYF